MWTTETENLIDAEAIAAMKDEAYLINIARAEVVNEAAMLAALHSGKLGGAFVDVWANEFEQPPHAELLSAPNLTFMPHTSGRSDVSHAFALDVFCDNLRRFINDEPLENVVDWERGY
jgi:phosphoglycerate dehydrogenase-like enzyme